MRKKIITVLLTGTLLIGNTIPVMAASAKNELSFVQLIGDVSSSNYTKALTNYCKIPENVRESFQLDGWTLSITTERLEDTWFAGWGYSAIASGYDDSIKEIRLKIQKTVQMQLFMKWVITWMGNLDIFPTLRNGKRFGKKSIPPDMAVVVP